MILLNPAARTHAQPDARSAEVMRRTIDFFEAKGKERLKADYHARVWYEDFLDFVREERIFATLLTPAGYAADEDGRWDTWRICEFAEILGFYGLQYWYTWQVSVLGLGPIWMSHNEAVKRRAAAALEDGGIFAFGLSEKAHGADIYSTDMVLTPHGDGRYAPTARKYYIGNGNEAAIVSTFGKLAGTDEYVFFAADSQHERYELVKNVVASQNYVSEFELRRLPGHRGRHPAHAATTPGTPRSTPSTSASTTSAGRRSASARTRSTRRSRTPHNRRLYGMHVTDFPHVRRMFVDAYARLVAMKLFALRAARLHALGVAPTTAATCSTTRW